MPKSTRVAVVMSHVFLRRLTEGMMSSVRRDRDYWVIDIYRPLDSLKNTLLEWNPVGIITEYLPGITDSILDLGIPTVIADTDETFPNTGSVDVDDMAIGKLAAEYFLNLGLRNFAFFGKDTPYSQQRWLGFQNSVSNAGYHASSLIDTFRGPQQYMEYWRGSESRLIEWIETLPKPVGIFAAHDPLGRSLCEACRDANISIPEQVAILGANNDELVCKMTNPPLSSISIPWDKIAFTSARLMDSMLEGHPPPDSPVIIPPKEIVPRQSSNILAVDDPRLSKALTYLRNHAFEGISVSEIARESHTSRRTIEQLFRKYLNRTPRDEIMRVRIEHSKELLTNTDFSMPLIAEKCGFSNAERFSIVFKQLIQIPPSQFRKRYRRE